MRKAVSLNPNPAGGSSASAPVSRSTRSTSPYTSESSRAHSGIAGQLRERARRAQAEEPAELVVAGHAALAVAHHVDGRQVQPVLAPSGSLLEIPEEARVVVEHQRAGVGDPERVAGEQRSSPRPRRRGGRGDPGTS